MELKLGIEEAFKKKGWKVVKDFSAWDRNQDPVVFSLQYLGRTFPPGGDRPRPTVEVSVICNADASLESFDQEILRTLYTVDDCLPELYGSEVEYSAFDEAVISIKAVRA